MVTCKIEITNPVGLHARPAAEFVRVAQKYRATITVRYEKREVNAKSILGVLSLGVKAHEQVILIAEGVDEQTALDALTSNLRSASTL